MNKTIHIVLAAVSLPLLSLAIPPLGKGGVPGGNLREIPVASLPPLRSANAAAKELPAEFPLSTQADIDACSTIDGNGDGKTWKFDAYAGNGGAACYEGIGTSGAADDYLVLGLVNFNASSGNYSLSFQTKKLVKDETFEICLSPTGTATDAVSVYSCTSVPSDWTQMDAEFSTASGEYYVMVHCNTPTPGLSLYIRNLVISAAQAQSFTVPFEMVPVAAEAKFFEFIDANNDGKTWKYDTSNDGLSYEFSKDMDADDYLLFPEIEIPQPGNYKFSFDANGYGTSTESLEVLFGQGDDPAMFPEVFADHAIGGTVYRRQVVVTVTEPGTYRPALHCSSLRNQYKLLTKNFRLEATDELPARHLPVEFTEHFTLSATSGAYSPSFILPDNSRVRISMEVKGTAVEVGIGNAPADPAQKKLFSIDAADDYTPVSRVVNVSDGGIRYLRLTSEGDADVKNISLQLVSEGDIYALPFFMQPTAEEFNEFLTINANNDDGVWSYYEPFGAARYNYSSVNDADDWLILPPVNINSTQEMIRFSLNCRGMTTNKLAETFEVWEGETSEPASMRKIYTSPEILTETFTPMEFSFAPTHTGKTYLAIRATSKKNSFHLFVRDLSVEADGRQTTVPRPVDGLSAKGAPMGSEEAIVTFKMPLFDEAGTQLDQETSLEATVSTSKATTPLTGTPGQDMTLNIENGQGKGKVTVTVRNSAGSSNPAVTEVYTGQDIPSPVTNLTATCSEDNRTMKITWTQPSEGANGGYADPAQMTFVIKHSSGGGSYTKVGTTDGVCEYSYSIPESYPLAMHYLSVIPTNIAGECDTPVGKGLMLGTPYAIPATEEFANGEIALQPLVMDKPDTSYTLDWYFENPAEALPEAANESGHALIAFTQQEGAARGCLHLPKFDTRSENGARLVLRLYNYPHFAPTHVTALTFDGPVSIGDIQPADEAGWVTYSLPIPAELMNRQWIEPVIDFGFSGNFDDEVWMLDAYGMEHYFDRELILKASDTHTSMTDQKEYVWRFVAANYGRETVSFTVPELNFTTLEGDVVSFPESTSPGAELTLATTETVELTYKVTLDAGMEGDLLYDITTLVEGDADLDNNTIYGETSLKVQKEYVVRSLTAERNADSGKINLSWEAPAVDSGNFNCESLESWDYSASLGLFTNLDLDKERTIGFNIASFPGMNAAKAWQVWDYLESGFGEIYMGHDLSTRSLIAFSPFDPTKQADDWLISPEVKGGTELLFFVRPLSYAYGREKIEIYTSSTGDIPEDFTLAQTFQTAEMEPNLTPYWENVKLTLPAEARYFAIRYVSHDIFGLQLDDISYTPAQADASQLTYSVIRDGQVIASGVSETSYTDDYNGSATYYVAAEKSYGGLHPLSNRAEVAEWSALPDIVAAGVSVSTAPGRIIIDIPADGIKAMVTAPDGKMIFSGNLPSGQTVIPVNPGIYLLGISDGYTRKLLVP